MRVGTYLFARVYACVSLCVQNGVMSLLHDVPLCLRIYTSEHMRAFTHTHTHTQREIHIHVYTQIHIQTDTLMYKQIQT